MTLPPHTRRLFFGYPDEDLLASRGRGLLLARLLEEGDSEDLRWLVATLGPAAVAERLDGTGGRLLSRRSRAFWELVLGRPAGGVGPGEELWPL